ncbi:MAG: MarR family winged helix-turn-helix transcriptional regulator, partial [Novosphingobium sp.]|nr:MarR family winged helix-turn-helix transcriptional regulator [Novosphingobium sp.]
GLIERRQDAKDRRLAIIVPTPAGLKQAKTIDESRKAMMRSVHSHFAPERLALLADLLEEYIAAVNAEGLAMIEKATGKP